MFRIHSPRNALARSFLFASATVLVLPVVAGAQTPGETLPPVTVTAPEQKRATAVRPPRASTRSAGAPRPARAPTAPQIASDQGRGAPAALGVLTVQQALAEINQ